MCLSDRLLRAISIVADYARRIEWGDLVAAALMGSASLLGVRNSDKEGWLHLHMCIANMSESCICGLSHYLYYFVDSAFLY